MGILAVTQHKNSQTHTMAEKSGLVSHFSNKISAKRMKGQQEGEDLVTAAEVAHIFHSIKHHHSYNSLDCSMKLNSKLYKDSHIAPKLSCGRTKSTAIVCNVLAKKALEIVLEELKRSDPPLFFGLQTDTSNKKNMNVFLVSIQIFNKENGLTNYLVDFYESADDSASGVFECLKQSMSSLGLDWEKVTSFSENNAICRLGSPDALFQNINTLNNDIIRANCHAHIIHNVAKQALGNLEIDMENLVLKIYSHFSVSAQRPDNIKDFYQFAETEFGEIAKHVTTKLLSLKPCIDKLLLSWEALSQYFVSNVKNLSKQLAKILQINQDSTEMPKEIELYLLFTTHAMEIFYKALKQLEKKEMCACDVFHVIEDLKNSLKNRHEQEFFGYQVHQCFRQLDPPIKNAALGDFKASYDTALKCLESHFDFSQTNPFRKLSKLCLKVSCPDFNSFVEVVEHFKLVGKLKLNMNDLFDEVSMLKENYALLSTSDKFQNCSCTSEKWYLLLKSVDFKFVNSFKVISYVLSMPGSSAFSEKVFGIMKSKWNDERNRCSLPLIKSELLIYFNFKDNCLDFADKIKNDVSVLKASKSSTKYV